MKWFLLPCVSKRKHGERVFEDVLPVPTVGTGVMEGWSTDGSDTTCLRTLAWMQSGDRTDCRYNS